MRPENLREINIRQVGDLITAIDTPDLPSAFALETVGFRPAREGMIGERDYGTKHRYANLPSSTKIVSNFNLYDKNTNTTYEFVAGLDGSNVLSLWVLDTTFGTDAWNTYLSNNNWIKLTATFATTLSAVSGVTADLATPTMTADNQFKGWIIINNDRNTTIPAFITASTIANNRITTSTNLDTQLWQAADDVVLYRFSGTWSTFNSSNGAVPHIRWADFEAQTAAFFYYGQSTAADNYPNQRNPLRIQRYNADRKYFYTNSSTSLITLDDNWFLDMGGGGLIPAFEQTGTMSAPKTGRISTDLTALTGTITVNGTTAVTGAGTAFLTECAIGQYIQSTISSAIEVRRIATITDDTNLTVESAFAQSGSPAGDFVSPANDITVDDISGQNWLKIRAYTISEQETAYSQTMTTRSGARVYATVTYDEGTKESDPVWQGFFNSGQDVSVNAFTDVSLLLWVNFAKMNKRISGLRFYYDFIDLETLTFSNVPDASSDYKLVFDLTFHTYQSNVTWSNDTTEADGYTYKAILPDFKFSFINPILLAGATNVKVNIGHEVDTNRSVMSPRFGVSASRGGGGVMVVDQSDSILRMSNYNGDGVHEEDNFADVTLDNVNLRQKIFLQARGELIGLGVANNNVLAFKRTEIEIINLISNVQQIIPVDCIARKSIISTPDGVFWAGKAGIFFFPADGSGIRIVNPLWKNLYDGTLRTDAGTSPRITEANRKLIVGGYNPVYRDVWFYLPTLDPDGTSRNLCYRYFLDYGQWRAREFNIGSDSTVQFFTTRKDNTFTVGYGHSTSANGLLEYPTGTSSLFWEDDVTAADATASKGIPTRLVMNIGELYNSAPNSFIHDIYVDAVGEMKSGTTGYYTIEFYANGEANAFDTKTHRFDQPPLRRKVTARGGIDELKLALSLPSTSLSDFKRWDISNITASFNQKEKLGTR